MNDPSDDLSADVVDEALIHRLVDEALLRRQKGNTVLQQQTAAIGTALFHGEGLWKETMLVPLREEHVQGENGVEGCYERSTLPREFIIALQTNTARRVQRELRRSKGQRGGMLHKFHRRPIDWIHIEHPTESVCEQMIRELRKTDAITSVLETGKEPEKIQLGEMSLSPQIYEGAVLVPQKQPHIVLAWADWYRSSVEDVTKRTPSNDEYIYWLLRDIESINMDEGLQMQELAIRMQHMLNFYTLNGGHPGSASVLFTRLVPYWKHLGYRSILLWRHKLQQVVDPLTDGYLAGGRLSNPQGGNDDSHMFFTERGIHDIGTSLSPLLAPRAINDAGDEICVASTREYMFGDLDEVEENCNEIDATKRAEYAQRQQ